MQDSSGFQPLTDVDPTLRLPIQQHASNSHLTVHSPSGQVLLTLKVEKAAWYKYEEVLVTRGEGEGEEGEKVARVKARVVEWGEGMGLRNGKFLSRERWWLPPSYLINPEDGKQYKIGSHPVTWTLSLIATQTNDKLGTFHLPQHLSPSPSHNNSPVGSVDLSPLTSERPEYAMLTQEGTRGTKLLELAVVAFVAFREERRRRGGG